MCNPASGLTYNLRIGLFPGGIDVMSPHSDRVSGRRRIPQIGNAPHGTRTRLVLPVGTYYWSVQAVDSALAGGPFASESSFTIVAPEPSATTAPPTAVLPAQATLRGEVDPRGLATSVSFEWGPTTAYGQRTPAQNVTGAGWRGMIQPLTGLNVGVLYHYRISAKSAGGTVFGADQTFITSRFTPGLVLAPGQVVDFQAWADYDKDGRVDIVVSTFDPATARTALQLWRNTGGAFVKSSTQLPAMDGTLAWGDYDRDGDLDLVVSGRADLPGQARFVTQVFRNTDGQFADIAAGLPSCEGSTAAWGDFDNDGDLDLLITGQGLPGQTFQLWRNQGGTFVQVPASFPKLSEPQALWADFDRDGDLDLIIMGGSEQGAVTQLYRNDGGVFQVESNQPLPGFLSGALAAGDFDNDGDLDLAIAGRPSGAPGASEGTLEVWRNDSGVSTWPQGTSPRCIVLNLPGAITTTMAN